MEFKRSDAPDIPSPEELGYAFIDLYYYMFQYFPKLLFKLYQDCSVLSRPDKDGTMTSVTTLKDINEKINSLQYYDCKVEITARDVQKSYLGGVTVLVIGCLVGMDNSRKKYVHSFFLAPQETGYFVLNDSFMYVRDDRPWGKDVPSVTSTTTTTLESSYVSDKVLHSKEKAREDTSKMSYASMLSSGKAKINVPTHPMKNQNYSVGSSSNASVPRPSARDRADTSLDFDGHGEDMECYPVYIGTLPTYVTRDQIEKEMNRFGPTSGGSIHRNGRGQYFAYVNFVSERSKNSAIQAEMVTIGGYKTIVAKKKNKQRIDHNALECWGRV